MNDSQSDFFVGKLFGAPAETPSLTLVYQAQDESRKVGFDFPDIEKVQEKVQEEFREMNEAFVDRESDPMHFREEVGDCFFALVNLCRHAGFDPEEVVRENFDKYLARCKYVEDQLTKADKRWSDLEPSEITILWKEAKRSGL